jgi:hypothetical protein
MPLFDSMIAATARRHGLTVVTRNVRDFEAADVDLIDPFLSRGSAGSVHDHEQRTGVSR